MSHPFGDNEYNRFGSAEFADIYDVAKAGMFKQKPNSLFVGFYGKRPLWYDGAGGVLLVAGARGGKLRDMLAYNLCSGICLGPIVVLDVKGELAAISQNQTADNKGNIYANPTGLHGLPQHRINPVDYLTKDNLALVSELKIFLENMMPPSGSSNGEYFERRARELSEGISLTLVKKNGVLTLPDLYHVINLIPANNDEWLDFAFLMSESGYPISKRVEEEIAASRDGHSGDGFTGILGELFKAFSCLSDPVLMDAVSPPFDFSFSQMCNEDQAYQVYLMPPAEYLEQWSPVIKALLVAGMVYKARKPQAPQQTWVIDECAQLGNFPLVTKLFTYGAGIGIRPVAVFQSRFQMKALEPDAENIISSSAAMQIYYTIRDLETARTISAMIGTQTLVFNDEMQQSRARYAKQKAVQAFFNGEDTLSAGLDYFHNKQASEMQSKQQRTLCTPEEVMEMSLNHAFIFTDALSKPLISDRRPYYEQKFMAGRYHPNPYHPPLDKVKSRTWYGHRWRKVITEAVPDQYAHYPQYKDGLWSYIEGYRP